jgi:hypothetical protein
MREVGVRSAECVGGEFVRHVAQTFAQCLTLGDLLRWASRQSPRSQIAEIITQDEFTHDIVLPFEGTFLSFEAS